MDHTNNETKLKRSYLFRRLYPFMKPYLSIFAIAVVLSLLVTGVEIVIAYFLQNIIDLALSKKIQEFMAFVYMMIGAIVLGTLFSYGYKYLVGAFTSKTVKDMRGFFFGHIEKLPIEYIEGKHSGDIVTYLNNGINAIEEFLSSELLNFIYQPARFLSAFIFMLIIDWRLTLFSCILIPLAAYLSNAITKPIAKNMREYQQYQGKANSVVQDAVGGIFIIKSFNLNSVIYKKYKDSLEQALEKDLKVERLNSLMEPVNVLLRLMPFVLCVILGGYLTVKNEISLGALMAFLNLQNYIIEPMTMVPKMMGSISKAMGSSSPMFSIQDEKVESENKEAFEIADKDTCIEFQDVSFAYNEEKSVLNNINFKVHSGQTVAVVGASGIGKSTILKLVSGYYKPNSGTVKLFGNDINKYNLSNVRKNIALVTQDIYLFPATIRENISYGQLNANEDAVLNAAEIANAHEFITKLDEGYDTLVGERGTKLSGGQKQRISIARAILKDAPLLLLDEPTSALDTQSEALIQKSIEKLMEKHTVLIVAHRLSTIKQADKILVLDETGIAEEGTHEELLSKNGLYKQIYTKQFLGQEERQQSSAKEGA